jgi:exosortase A
MVNTPLSPASAVLELAPARRDWIIAGIALVIGVCAFGYLFRGEIVLAVRVWANSDAFNHCYLVLPVAAYLAWERRQAITATLPRPIPWIALLAVPMAAVWFAADRLGIMEARQLAAMTLFQIMVLAIIGWAAWRSLAAPLLYLYFLVPFGEFVVAPLQTLVVHFATFGLNLVGVPTFTDGIMIQIPEGSFLVHTACSGLRFLIASAAFGVLYACVMYTSPLRRLVFSVFAVVIAIVANCFRVFGTILIAHFWGNVRAVEADHVVWGWGFYVIVGAMLILIGFHFRQQPNWTTGIVARASGRIAVPAAIALAMIVFSAAVPSVAADYMDRVNAGPLAASALPMPTLAGCTGPTAAGSAAGISAAAEAAGSALYRCDGEAFRLTFYRFAPRIGVRPLFLAYNAAQTPPSGGDIMQQTGYFRTARRADAPVWQVTSAGVGNGHFVAVARALWLNGRPIAGGIGARLDQALNSLRRAPRAPVLAAVTVFGNSGPNETLQIMRRFLAKTGGLSQWVERWLSEPKTASRG